MKKQIAYLRNLNVCAFDGLDVETFKTSLETHEDEVYMSIPKSKREHILKAAWKAVIQTMYVGQGNFPTEVKNTEHGFGVLANLWGFDFCEERRYGLVFVREDTFQDDEWIAAGYSYQSAQEAIDNGQVIEFVQQ